MPPGVALMDPPYGNDCNLRNGIANSGWTYVAASSIGVRSRKAQRIVSGNPVASDMNPVSNRASPGVPPPIFIGPLINECRARPAISRPSGRQPLRRAAAKATASKRAASSPHRRVQRFQGRRASRRTCRSRPQDREHAAAIRSGFECPHPARIVLRRFVQRIRDRRRRQERALDGSDAWFGDSASLQGIKISSLFRNAGRRRRL